MISLKSIITEQEVIEQTPNVLFVGDEELFNTPKNFARILLKSKQISGDIVTKPNINTENLQDLIDSNITKKHNIVTIFDSSNDPKKISNKESITNLINAYDAAKQHGAILIVVSNTDANKLYNTKLDKLHTWILNQNIADYVIDANKFINKQNFDSQEFLDDAAHKVIAKKWKKLILSDDELDDKVVDDSLELKRGDSGDIIHDIQFRLVKLKYNIGNLGLTGNFDRNLEKAIKKFQRKNNLTITGIINDKTYQAIFDNDAISGIDTDDKSDKYSSSGMPASIADYIFIIIDKFEGGYYNPGMEEASDPIYGDSGETMMGIDRKHSSYEEDTTAGKEFWKIIDENSGWSEEEVNEFKIPKLKEILLNEVSIGTVIKIGKIIKKVKDVYDDVFEDDPEKWPYNYRGGTHEKKLKDLVVQMIEPQFEELYSRYINPDAKEIIDTDYNLKFHFVRATYNGSGWFKYFAEIINNAVTNKDIKNPKELGDIAIDSRINSTYSGDPRSKELIRRSGIKLKNEFKPYE
jgi:peptidoglycan hydrolase-like protein with peptidoglycan-binding domain